MALTDSLISHWKLDESSGTRNDSHGANHLTDNATVGVAAGKLGNAASFASASSEYLSKTDNADLSVGGNISFTFAAWIYPTELTSVRPIIFKGTANTVAGIAVRFRIETASATRLFVSDGTNAAQVDNTLTLIASNWYFVVGWYDASEGKLKVQINNGVPAETSFTYGAQNDAGDFTIGTSVGSAYFQGSIDSVSFWKRVLTAKERSDLYYGGRGLDYPFNQEIIYEYNRPFESYENFAAALTTGNYNESTSIINLASGAQTGLFPPNLPFQLTWVNGSDFPNLYDDPAIEVVNVTGRHASGFYVSRAQNFTTGSVHTGTKLNYLIQPIYASTYEDKWKYLHNPDETAYFFDDFDWGVGTSSVLGWTTAGGGGFTIGSLSNARTLGVAYQATTPSGAATLRRLNNKLFRLDSGPITYKTFAINNNQSSTPFEFLFGLGDGTTSGDLPANGVFFHYDSRSGERLYLVSAKDSVYNYVASQTGMLRLSVTDGDFRIEVRNSGLASFYYKNVELSGSPITTNIPWGSGYEVGPFAQTKAYGTNIRFGQDYVETYQSFTGYRTNPLLYEDLVAYWPLYEASGTGYDVHVNGYHLTGREGNPAGVSGVLISGRRFNGAASSGTLFTENTNMNLHSTGSGQGFSVSCWYRPFDNVSNKILSQGNANNQFEWYLQIGNQVSLATYSGSGNLGGNAAYSAVGAQVISGWNFVYAEYNNVTNTNMLFLNGTRTLGTAGGAKGMWTKSGRLTVGGELFGSSYQSRANAIISNIGIWNRTLTTGEQLYLYNNSGGLDYDSLRHYNDYYET